MTVKQVSLFVRYVIFHLIPPDLTCLGDQAEAARRYGCPDEVEGQMLCKENGEVPLQKFKELKPPSPNIMDMLSSARPVIAELTMST